MPHRSLQIIRAEHASLATILRSMRLLVEKGPGDDSPQFFDVLRGMLFYIDEFPERQHHPKESNLLFPRVVKAAPHLEKLVQRLERDHVSGRLPASGGRSARPAGRLCSAVPAARARPAASGLSVNTAENPGAMLAGSAPPPHSHRLLIAGWPVASRFSLSG